MSEDTWPEFLYGGLTIADYVQKVLSERDVKSELQSLVDLIRDIAKFPHETPDQTFQHINQICRAMRALLLQL